MNAILSFVDPPLLQSGRVGQISLVAGKPSSFIVSLENSQNSSSSFSLTILEAALHYPRYFGYHIQNFTVQRLQNTLEPTQQVGSLNTHMRFLIPFFQHCFAFRFRLVSIIPLFQQCNSQDNTLTWPSS